MRNYDSYQEKLQTAWREKHIHVKEYGVQNGKEHSWILPSGDWELGLWPGIRSGSAHSLPAYLEREKVQKHDGVHNLKSSWMLCANLYFPFQHDLPLIAGFLREYIEPLIESVEKIVFEYAEVSLSPAFLLGEPEGQRGKNQTSPDVAFICTLDRERRGLILVENKFTEHSFYECSGRKKEYGNPDRTRCIDFQTLADNPEKACYMTEWELGRRTNRRYWDYIAFSDSGLKDLKRCPAAIAGYQLFRQQALAEAIVRAQGSPYNKVISCVAHDARNETLMRSMRGAGIRDFTTDWATLFEGKTSFSTFTHQQWVSWVKKHDSNRRWRDWLVYVQERYGFL